MCLMYLKKYQIILCNIYDHYPKIYKNHYIEYIHVYLIKNMIPMNLYK